MTATKFSINQAQLLMLWCVIEIYAKLVKQKSSVVYHSLSYVRKTTVHIAWEVIETKAETWQLHLWMLEKNKKTLLGMMEYVGACALVGWLSVGGEEKHLFGQTAQLLTWFIMTYINHNG